MSIDRGMDKDVVHVYNGTLFSHWKEWIMPFVATWVDLEMLIPSEIRQGKRNIIWYLLHVESKKKWYKWTYAQTRNRFTDLWLPGWRMGEGIIRVFKIDMNTLLYLKWITNKDLLSSTGNSAQCYVAAWMGGVLGENGYTYTCGRVLLLSTWNSQRC